MLYDLDFSWTIAVAILIGLGLLLSFISEGKDMTFTTILIYMTIINGFIVSTGILPLWTEVMFLLIIVAIALIRKNSYRVRGF